VSPLPQEGGEGGRRREEEVVEGEKEG